MKLTKTQSEAIINEIKAKNNRIIHQKVDEAIAAKKYPKECNEIIKLVRELEKITNDFNTKKAQLKSKANRLVSGLTIDYWTKYDDTQIVRSVIERMYALKENYAGLERELILASIEGFNVEEFINSHLLPNK